MNQPTLIALALLTSAGCSSDPASPTGSSGPCAAPTGAWQATYKEHGTTCGIGSFDVVTVFGGAPSAAEQSCTGTESASADGCTVTIKDLRCGDSKNGYQTSNGVLRLVADDKLTGTMQLTIEPSPGDPGCTDVFDVTAHPL